MITPLPTNKTAAMHKLIPYVVVATDVACADRPNIFTFPPKKIKQNVKRKNNENDLLRLKKLYF